MEDSFFYAKKQQLQFVLAGLLILFGFFNPTLFGPGVLLLWLAIWRTKKPIVSLYEHHLEVQWAAISPRRWIRYRDAQLDKSLSVLTLVVNDDKPLPLPSVHFSPHDEARLRREIPERLNRAARRSKKGLDESEYQWQRHVPSEGRPLLFLGLGL
ncbi:MAG: hypothetical protein AAGA56_11325, partial [Myxococcota bacterium]